jgi:hypothetical protein
MRHVVVSLAVVGWTTLAAAQDSAATRRALIQRAAVARDRGDHTLALTLAVEASRIGTTPSLRAFIAHEHAALGQHAESLTEAEACVREAEQSPPRPERDTLLAECRTLVSAQRPLLRRASVAVSPASPAPRAALDVTPPRSDSHRGVTLGPWIVGGVGVASLSLSLVFVGLRADALSSRDARCQGRAPCTLSTPEEVSAAVEARERAAEHSTAVNVSLAVGGAALAASAVWFALDHARRSPRVTPSVSTDGRSSALLHLSGSF